MVLQPSCRTEILVQTSNAFSVDKNGVHDPVGNESQAAIQAQPSGRFRGFISRSRRDSFCLLTRLSADQ